METKDLTKQVDKLTNNLSTEQQKNKVSITDIDSLKKQILILQDSLARKQAELNKQNGLPEKELSEDEKLRMMIEKEREERRKKKEEEELKRKEEEKGNGNG